MEPIDGEMMKEEARLEPVVRRFIEDAGNATRSLGVGRVLGQIYAYLYFSREPRSLSDMQSVLGISKGSSSTGIRQLEQWEAVRKIWVKGDRKDYYEANDWFGQILKNAIVNTVGKKMAALTSLLTEVSFDPSDAASFNGDKEFIEERIKHLRTFNDKAQQLWNSPVIKMFLK